MLRNIIVPVLAVAGVCVAAYTVVQGSKPVVALPPAVEPPSAPYANFVAGSALVEASTQNIAIGTPVGGVVVEVAVRVGAQVKAGDVLFRLDDRSAKAEVAARRAALDVVESQLKKLKAGPRPEELPPARARVAEMEALLADAKDQLVMRRRVADQGAVSADAISRLEFAVRAGEARVAAAQAELRLLEAGAWSADLAVAGAQVASARAGLEAAEVEVERLSVRSPVDGRVLQANVRVGEFAAAGVTSGAGGTPHMVVGSVTPLHVRVDVDENDAWRVKAGAEGMAYVRGNKDISAALTFVRFEPLVVPKKSLTGESTERVDTRVLQVIFSFEPRDLPVYVGQQMDIYIKADADPRRGEAAGGKK